MARVALAILVLFASGSPAQAQADAHSLQLLHDWVTAVNTHVPGAFDEAVTSIAAWDRGDLLRAQPLVRALVAFMGDQRRAQPMRRAQLREADAAEVKTIAKLAQGTLDANDFIKRAALLHTDIVLLAQRFPASVPPPKPRSQQSRIER